MNEGEPSNIEEGIESIPTPEEVRSVFDQLIEGVEYKDVRKLEDEQGLYLWDIINEGEDTAYLYMRKGRYSEGQALTTSVNVIFYDDGIPVGGHSVAKLIDGEWKLTP